MSEKFIKENLNTQQFFNDDEVTSVAIQYLVVQYKMIRFYVHSFLCSTFTEELKRKRYPNATLDAGTEHGIQLS